MLVLKVRDETKNLPSIKIGSNKITIGRSSQCDYKVSDSMCSSIHCAMRLDSAGKLILKDLDSTNGTTVNGTKVLETFIYIGDIINIGNITIEIDQTNLTPEEIEIHKSDVVRKHKMPEIRVGGNKSAPKSSNPNELTLEMSKTAQQRIEKNKKMESTYKDKDLEDTGFKKGILRRIVDFIKKK